ncbi:MAG: aminotransferase class V-fold PLP-dependent enzyme, partial [Gemmatimonadaceae bacterium]
ERGDVVYLNNASTGPLPQSAVRAAEEWARLRAEPWRISEAMEFGTLRSVRERVARLVGATPGEIALTTNTGHGINLAARALPLAAGDVVVTSDLEFPANVYPWQALERARGVRTRLVPTRDRLPDEDALVAALDEPRVKALAVSWVSFATGYTVDLARLGRACRERGVYFVVDAIQGVGARTLSLAELDVDLLACGGQKWLLSPWGTGFVYVREPLVRELEPTPVGWMAVKGSEDFTRLTDYALDWHDDARRFEMVTLPYQDFAAMDASLALFEQLGPARIEAHVRALADRIVDWARERSDVRLVTPADPARRAGIVAVAARDPRAASVRLTSAGVVHSLREGAIRLSPHCYNTPEEMGRVLELMA